MLRLYWKARVSTGSAPPGIRPAATLGQLGAGFESPHRGSRFPQLAEGRIAARTGDTLRSTVPVGSAATWRGLFPGRWLGLLRTYGVRRVIVGVLPGCGRCYEGF